MARRYLQENNVSHYNMTDAKIDLPFAPIKERIEYVRLVLIDNVDKYSVKERKYRPLRRLLAS